MKWLWKQPLLLRLANTLKTVVVVWRCVPQLHSMTPTCCNWCPILTSGWLLDAFVCNNAQVSSRTTWLVSLVCGTCKIMQYSKRCLPSCGDAVIWNNRNKEITLIDRKWNHSVIAVIACVELNTWRGCCKNMYSLVPTAHPLLTKRVWRSLSISWLCWVSSFDSEQANEIAQCYNSTASENVLRHKDVIIQLFKYQGFAASISCVILLLLQCPPGWHHNLIVPQHRLLNERDHLVITKKKKGLAHNLTRQHIFACTCEWFMAACVISNTLLFVPLPSSSSPFPCPFLSHPSLSSRGSGWVQWLLSTSLSSKLLFKRRKVHPLWWTLPHR